MGVGVVGDVGDVGTLLSEVGGGEVGCVELGAVGVGLSGLGRFSFCRFGLGLVGRVGWGGIVGFGLGLLLSEVGGVEVDPLAVGIDALGGFWLGRLGWGCVGWVGLGCVGCLVGLGFGVDLGTVCPVGITKGVGSRYGLGWGSVDQAGSLVGFRFARSGARFRGGLGFECWYFFKCNVLGVSGELLLSASFLLG